MRKVQALLLPLLNIQSQFWRHRHQMVDQSMWSSSPSAPHFSEWRAAEMSEAMSAKLVIGVLL